MLNTQAYSLNAMPYFSIGKYIGDMPLAVTNMEPLDMAYTASDIEKNTPHFAEDVRSNSAILDPSIINTQPSDMAYTASDIEKNTPHFAEDVRSNSAILDPSIINTQPSDMPHTVSDIGKNTPYFAEELRSNRAILDPPSTNTQPSDMPHTVSDIGKNTPYFAEELRSNRAILDPPSTNTQPSGMPHTASDIEKNTPYFAEDVRSNRAILDPPSINAQPSDMPHTASDIEKNTPYFAEDVRSNRAILDPPSTNTQPSDMPHTASDIEKNTPYFAEDVRSNRAILDPPSTNTQPSDMPHTASDIEKNTPYFAEDVRSNRAILDPPSTNTQPSDMPHTVSDIGKNTPYFAEELRSNRAILDPPSINAQPSDMPHTASDIEKNTPHFAEEVRSNSAMLDPSIINTQPSDMTHTASDIEKNTPHFAEEVRSNSAMLDPSIINTQPSDMTHTSFDQDVIINNEDRSEFIDIQAKIEEFFTIPEPSHPPKIIERRSQHEFHDSFIYTLREQSFSQSTYNRNRTTLFFQASANHLNIRDLQKNDLVLSENGIEIENYTLSPTRRRLNHDLEVVFVVDAGGSMDDYGENVKENIIYLVNRLQEAEIHTKFCLLKFTDLVRDNQCNMFFPDNPITPEDENSIKFLNDVSRLKFEEKSTFKQNALGGLLTASSQTPWSANSQRMIVLITDAMFWIAIEPDIEARTAPDYKDVLESLEQNEIQVFSLTQDYSGFSKNYSRELFSISGATSGQWFQIKSLNNQDMDSIFGQAKEQIDISYKIEYFVEDQEGLNASLPLDERQVILTAYNPEEINIQMRGDVYSSMPEGSSQLQSYWPLNERAIVNENYVAVTVNEQPEDDFFIENGEVIFPNPPPSGSEIFVQYEIGSLRDNIREHSLLLQIDPTHQDSLNTQTSSVSLKLNDIVVSDQDFEITPLDSTDSMQLYLSENIFDNTDPYNIRNSGELRISLWYEIVTQHNSIN